jgi:hypothetical protein
MSVFAINTSVTQPFFSQSVVLDGSNYILRFQYNQRESVYYLSIMDAALGTDILSGIKLVSNWSLIQRYNGGDIVGLPPGELLVVPNSTNDSPPTFGELGIGYPYTLYYLDQAFLQTGV